MPTRGLGFIVGRQGGEPGRAEAHDGDPNLASHGVFYQLGRPFDCLSKLGFWSLMYFSVCFRSSFFLTYTPPLQFQLSRLDSADIYFRVPKSSNYTYQGYFANLFDL